MADLRTDYKDDVLDTSKNEKRKYNLIQNEDGTVSLEDVTEYLQEGDSYGAVAINEQNTKINEIDSSLNMHYNPETDMIQIFDNGVWTDWKLANIKADYLFKNGIGLQDDIGLLVTSNTSSYGTYSTTNECISIKSTDTVYGPNIAFTKSLKDYIGKGKRIYIRYNMTNASGKFFALRSVKSATASGQVLNTVQLSHSTDITTESVALDDLITTDAPYLAIGYTNQNNTVYIYDVYIQ